MPVNTVQSYLKTVLDGQNLPLGLGALTARVAPLPVDDGTGARAYIWGSHGDEVRRSVPRAQTGSLATGGVKEITHQCDVWLVWFGSFEAPQVDLQFPSILDFVLATLRNAPLIDAADHAFDPVTGQSSQLLKVGENMSWVFPPPRAMRNQRTWRYDAQITVEIVEMIQA